MAQKRRQSDVITPDRKRRAQRLQTAAEKRRRQLNQPIAAALSCASWFPRHEAFTESDHPDHPKRLNACLCGITGRGLWLGTLTVADRLATDEELYLAHQRAHVSGLKRAEKAAQPEEEEEDTERNLGSVIWLPRAGHLAKIASADFPRVRGTKSDTFVTATSLEAARASVGGLLELVDECLLRTKVPGFALCRPPGHHAGISSSTGFCLVNNVAIAARYAQRTYPDLINRVMIFDWDVHHGQGTQEIFWKDPNVLVVSAHLFAKGFYPNSGTAEEVGEDEGRGYNINIALPVGYTDECLMRVFDDVLLPAARRFRPDLILVSAGFDAMVDDPLGEAQCTAAGFGQLTRRLWNLAAELAKGRLIFALEGGYHVGCLAQGTAAVLKSLLERTDEKEGPKLAKAPEDSIQAIGPQGPLPESIQAIWATRRAHQDLSMQLGNGAVMPFRKRSREQSEQSEQTPKLLEADGV